MGEVGLCATSSVGSSVLVRDRGLWWSGEERMKDNLDNRPPVPEVLRFRVMPVPGDRLDAELGCSRPFISDVCSILLVLEARDRHVACVC